MAVQEVGITPDLTARPGERFLELLPNGIPLYLADYAVDKVSKAEKQRMLAEQAKITALGDPALQLEGFRSQSRILRRFSKDEGTFRAIEDLYTDAESGASELLEELGGISDKQFREDKAVAKMWFRNFENAAGVRERGEIARRIILEAARDTFKNNPNQPVRIGSIACGSSRIVLESLQQLKKEGVWAKACLLDNDKNALTYARKLAEQMGVESNIETIEGNVVRLGGRFVKELYDFIEGLGIMDYFKWEILARIFMPQLHKYTREGGRVLASNVIDNDERTFLETAVGWRRMDYKTPENFSNAFIAPGVGFKAKDCRAYLTPNRLYAVVEAQKAA